MIFRYRSGKPHLVRLRKKTVLRRFSAPILNGDENPLIFRNFVSWRLNIFAVLND